MLVDFASREPEHQFAGSGADYTGHEPRGAVHVRRPKKGRGKMKAPVTIATAVLGLLFMAGAAFADHSIYHGSNKLFGDPSNTWRVGPSFSNPYDKQFGRRRMSSPSRTAPAYPTIRDLSDHKFGPHRPGPPDNSIHDQADKLFGR